MIVGEAPGATEDATGLPFQGGSGELLNHMLGRAGIIRSMCFVTNVCHVRPPENKFEWFLKKENQIHFLQGVFQLKKDITEIKPNVVIGLGVRALETLTGKTSIEKWRGSVVESTLVPGQKTISTWHPAFVLRVFDYKAIVETDLAKAKRHSEFPELRLPERELILNPDMSTRLAIGKELYNAEWLAIDIECSERGPGDWVLTCVGFSDKAGRALTIPTTSKLDLEFVAWLCGSPAKKVLQNGTFDVTVLRGAGIEVTNFVWDTMIVHHALYPESASSTDEVSMLSGKKRQAAIAKGLAFQASFYTDEPYYKDDGKLWKDTGDINMFYRYNALDAAVTREIRDVQEKDVATFGIPQVVEHQMSLVEPLMHATEVGLKIDLKLRSEMCAQIDGEIANLQKFLDSGAGWHVNVKSPDVPKLLYGQLGLKPSRYSDKTGKPSGDADSIIKLAEKYKHPLLLTILAIRERRDIVERYLNTKVDSDGRIRCSFDITGTRTFRLSSRSSIYGSGSNLQNQPPKVREIYVPDEGHVFIYADYSQAEARVVAHLAEEEELIKLFEDPNRDVHKENAARINNVDVGLVTPEQRYLAKRVIHASNYGMEPPRMVEVVNGDAVDSWGRKGTGVFIDLQTARRLIDAYFMLYPNIRNVFWKEAENDLRQTRILVNPWGFKRTFFGRFDEKLKKEAYSYKPQSAIGVLCCKALVQCYHAFKKATDLKATVLVNVHDALLVQCADTKIKETIEVMQHEMHIPIPIKGRNLIVPTDFKVGLNWGEKDKKTGANPNGLGSIQW